jgi:predicted flap endonuclease-1-like 5' DNA nuclease
MNERFTSDLVFILIALIVAALLGFIIGYLCRRIRKARFIALENEKEQLSIKLDASVKQLNACNRKLEDCINQKDKAVAFDAVAARNAFSMKITENDLKIVEGIGEKIASILNKRGIVTWLQLSQKSPEAIKDILLEDGGPTYKIHEPKTWPEQALMAYEGKWTQLKEYQEQLTAGR